ncbi:dihydrolipoyllysine-residue acetyltransferase [Thalassoglobus polymorphus]|uniref:Dihydrolipoamide acetyltransferase component of pyruvate dehydrogenase complex n=1 Tax=Thalassoglobus polymorphus TaxID=2527994 RepID=A0A517QLX7_9PLAN|nr:dihydrolipoyllysine-residue acetyltransferase [Thalassoglobus polymorphus]QDT32601.1 Dihydrolipoyllysine-residue acetyltransferase component of pyruvate dehydrogenase complex [Thalassoglobus polymorphus]
MSTSWELPNIGEGVDEADVAEILVSEGDQVEPTQALMELETEKAVVELPAPAAGIVKKILVSSGDTIQVGQAYMEVEETSGAANSSKPAEAAAETTSDSAKSQETENTEEVVEVSAEAEPELAASRTEIVTGSVDFDLPPLGEGVDSADVAEIMVSEGDTVAVGDPLMELETDKAVVELPSEHAGKITKIHVSEGDSLPVGSLVMTFEVSDSVPASKTAAPPQETASSSANEPSKEEVKAKSADQAPARSTPAKQAPAQTTATISTSSDDNDSNGTPVPAAPSTRRLARELGVNLRDVQGSGSGGRISQEDVQKYVKGQLQGTSLSRTVASSSGSVLAAGSIAPPPLPDFSKYGVIEREKMNKLARTAAENLTVSWNVIPHVTQHDRADITDLEEARKRFGQGIGKNGPKVTMTAIVIKALTTCLQAFPKFNSSLDPETNEIVYKKYYNIGCAVDTPNGLVVPVITDCDKKSILDIAADVTDLAVKARDRKLSVNEMQGATCTVTNIGGIGGVGFTPIVNYPEVCIMGMCRGQKELKLIDGNVQERLILPVSLSYDHRVINGAEAARFVVTFCNLLNDPFQLLTTV